MPDMPLPLATDTGRIPPPRRGRLGWAPLLGSVIGAVTGTVFLGCTVTPNPGGVSDPQTATTTALDAGPETLGATSGLPTDSTLASLSSTDAATLCDWVNGRQGGYGRPITFCTGGTAERTDPNQTTCVNEFSALGNRCLDLTVGTIEDCVNQTGTDLCLEESTVPCMTIKTCGLGM